MQAQFIHSDDHKMVVKYYQNKKRVHDFIEELLMELFPLISDEETIGVQVMDDKLFNDFKDVLSIFIKSSEKIKNVSSEFRDTLNALPVLLKKDALFILNNDPAANSIVEVITTYPGFYAIAVYRIAHLMVKYDIDVLPRILTEYAHGKTGIDIHPGATIGEYFSIDHGTGVVIGETTNIGERVVLYQGVTLGALNVAKDQTGIKRHPTVEHDTIIYAGATILGGKTVIGHHSVIGGNVWLTQSVQPFSLVLNQSETQIISKEKS